MPLHKCLHKGSYVIGLTNYLANSRSSPSWKATSSSASQDIQFPALYGTNGSLSCQQPTLVPIFNHINSVYTLTSWFVQKWLNILSSHLYVGFPSCLFPSCFPIKSVYIFLFSHLHCHSSHFPWFYHPHNIHWGVQNMILLIISFSPISCYFLSQSHKYLPSLCSSLNLLAPELFF